MHVPESSWPQQSTLRVQRLWLLWEGEPDPLGGGVFPARDRGREPAENPACLEEPKSLGREATCSPDSSLVLRGALPEPTLLQRREPGLVSRHMVIKEVNRQEC